MIERSKAMSYRIGLRCDSIQSRAFPILILRSHRGHILNKLISIYHDFWQLQLSQRGSNVHTTSPKEYVSQLSGNIVQDPKAHLPLVSIISEFSLIECQAPRISANQLLRFPRFPSSIIDTSRAILRGSSWRHGGALILRVLKSSGINLLRSGPEDALKRTGQKSIESGTGLVFERWVSRPK